MTSARRSPRAFRLGAVGSVSLAILVVAVSYGAAATSAGIPAWLVVLSSVLVLAGASELLFVAVIAVGGSPWLAALSGLLVNLRNGVYGMSAGRYLAPGPTRWLGAHLANDESAAFAAAQPTPGERRRAFWQMGVGVLVAWPLGATLGVLVGGALPDPDVLGLDAAFPVVLIAMLLGALRDGGSVVAAVVGAAIAVVATPVLPAGTAPLLALVALLVPFVPRLIGRGRA